MGNKASSEELDDVHLSELLMTQLESLFRTFDLNTMEALIWRKSKQLSRMHQRKARQ